MKKLYKYIVSVIGILAFSACADDVDFPIVAEEGTDVTLTLNIQASADKNIVVSRATNDENKLYDLHFYVFNQQGKLTGYEQRVHDKGFIIPADDKGNILTDQDGNTMLQNITIRTKTGISTIYALANINQGDTYYLENGIKARLKVTDQATNDMNDSELAAKVKESTLKLSDFKNIQYLRQAGDESKWFSPTPQHNKYVMSGYLNNGHEVTINKEGTTVSIEGSDDNIIKLYRILAKNTLTIDWNSSGGQFTPKYYKLCEVPTKGMLIPNTDINTAYGETTDLYLTKANITDEKVQNIPVISTYRENLSLTSEEKTAKSFELVFYYPENLRSYASNSNIKQWKDRENNTYGAAGKSFDNAPSKAAYIELYGDYVSSDGNLTANVSYTIHLGNFSQKTGAGDDVAALNAKRMSDFNVVRNHNYIYNVHIKGVNDIIAEAKDENNNPYAEGLVIQKGDGVNYEVDAHYEARVMKFSRATMQTLKGSEGNPGYVVNISTPFGNTTQTLMVKNMTHNGKTGDYICSSVGTPLALLNSDGTYKELGDDKVFVGEQDYSWMEFVRNTDGNMHNELDPTLYPCKYPRSTDTTNPKLNVFQLLAELYKTTGDGNVYDLYGITTDDDKEVYYTCFINEYYYNKKSWATYANKPNRYMQIAIQKDNLHVSDDNKSVYAEVAYSISQRSISTFYNPLLNIVAFGTENVDEEDVYDVRLGQNSSTYYYSYYENMTNVSPQNWKGWTSATANMKDGERPWYDNENNNNVALVNVQGVQPMYRAALKACMSRNRDNDGDGLIDRDEIRWYLATVDQYRALFYGQSLLDEDVRLFGTQEDMAMLASLNNREYNFEVRGKLHYWTASNRANSGTFWPEEGMTNNPAGNAREYLGWNGVCRAELVRCVRTLGNGTTTTTDNGTTTITEDNGLKDPTEFFDFYSTDDSGNRNVISVHGMVVKRIPSVEALPNHNESEDKWNDFTSKIAVAAHDLINGSQEAGFSSTIAGGDDPCSSYRNQNNAEDYEKGFNWRMPNQKEFALILATVDKMPATGFDKSNLTTGN